MHGFESGYYQLRNGKNKFEKVYLDIKSEQVKVYPVTKNKLSNTASAIITLTPDDSLCVFPQVFVKKSLDIDITTILFKYRPAIYGHPPQMTADFNAAIYAGWRRDNYHIQSKRNPLGVCNNKIINRGYDVGFFAGPGTTTVGPFSTQNRVTDEYNGMILQFGLSGFIESTVASFGIATGIDYLLSSDRDKWIYNMKPWVGFIIGIALN